MKHRLAVVGFAAGLLGGGAIGFTLLAPGVSGAQTTTTNPPAATTPAPASGTAPGGQSTTSPKSNEDATHEAGESAAHEADENSGVFHRHAGGGSNEGAAHEATESPQREAGEGTGAQPTAPAQTAPATTPSTAANA